MIQKVNTDKINDSIRAIETADSSLNSKFDEVSRFSYQINDKWRGAAGSRASTILHEMINENRIRSKEFISYRDLLSTVVLPNVQNTENQNIRLAEMFK